MPTLKYENTPPTSDEFGRALAEVMGRTNPVDDLLELSDELREFEQRYQLPSQKFYADYRAGMLNDELQHNVEWAATYELFLKTKVKLEAALMRAAVQAESLEPA